MFAVMVEARREGDLANPFAQETAYEAAQGQHVTHTPSLSPSSAVACQHLPAPANTGCAQ